MCATAVTTNRLHYIMIISVSKLQMYMKSSHVFEPGATWSSGKK